MSPAVNSDPLEGQVIEDRYRLLKRIGSGGMSVVYLAERLGIGKHLAIKFLRSAFVNLPDFVRRFEQEARACSRLSHLHLVSVIDFGVALGSPYLVMEYVNGRLLSHLVGSGPITPGRSIAIMRQILSGLRHAHTRGVIHRDLKPGNVMLAEMTGTADFVKIMDFGTAQLLTGDADDPRSSGTDVGTPWYMAPEQAAGQATDQRTDIYTAGVILFEMLTGERPYVADDPMRVLQMHLQNPIPSVRALKPEIGVSPELEGVMVKAMQKQPEDRFDSAEAFDLDLQKVPEIKPRRSPTAPMNPIRSPAAPMNHAAPAPIVPSITAEIEPGDPPVKNKRLVLFWIVLSCLLVAGAVAVLVISG